MSSYEFMLKSFKELKKRFFQILVWDYFYFSFHFWTLKSGMGGEFFGTTYTFTFLLNAILHFSGSYFHLYIYINVLGYKECRSTARIYFPFF